MEKYHLRAKKEWGRFLPLFLSNKWSEFRMDAVLIERKLGTIESLPTLPLVLRQIQKIMRDPRSNMAQIATVVAKDQAIASRTIRLVNSAFYGLREHVTSINHAIVILGLKTLNNLMISLTVIKLFNDREIPGFSSEKFWEHCFGTALIAKYLAQATNIKDEEEYFIAGLLHDMGRLALEQFLHNEFAESLVQVKLKNISLFEAEKKVIGFDHGEAGAWLGKKWGLPEALTVAMEFHHRSSVVPSDGLQFQTIVKIVSAATELCTSAAIGSSGEISKNPMAGLPKIEGIKYEQITEIIDKVRSEVKSVIGEWKKS
jgi:putative nucleotidyltransferase with HDIG domain